MLARRRARIEGDEVKGLSICRYADAPTTVGHPVAGHTADGAAGRALHPAGYSLWMVELDLPRGGTIGLPEAHGDEIVYVKAGSVTVAGQTCRAGGAVIVESDAHPEVAADEGAIVLHMGSATPGVPDDGLNGPISRAPDQVHVVGPDGWLALATPGRLSKYFADSTCAGCRATLLYTSRDDAYVSPAHSHSVDELIHVVGGEIRLGAHRLGPGDTLAVGADQRYGFRADTGFAFLNYRRDASRQTIVQADAPLMEGGLINGFQPVVGVES